MRTEEKARAEYFQIKVAGFWERPATLIRLKANVSCLWEDKSHCHSCWDSGFARLCDAESSQDLLSSQAYDSSPMLPAWFQSALMLFAHWAVWHPNHLCLNLK